MTQKTKILCTIPITRHWALNQLFTSLLALRVPPDCELNYYLYIDSPDPRIKEGVDYWVEELAARNFTVAWHYSKRPEPSEVRIAARRERVIEVHKDLARLVNGGSDYIFGVEDDTIVPPYALERLLRFAKRNPDMGLIQGVQCGRWGEKMIGAWRVNDIENPTKVVTYPYMAVNRDHSFIEPIDGGGFYCYLTPAKLFCEADYRVEAECLGVDMLYGLDLRRKGYKNYIDWSVVCGHNDFGLLIEPGVGAPCVQVLYGLEGGKWKMTVLGGKK